jgi:RNA polymerase sigma-70 factor, ECF subfamily
MRGLAMMQDAVGLLLQQVAAGDRAAFRILYEKTNDTLFGVLMRMLQNRANAEDGLQEVFARVWIRAHSYAPERGSGMTWLITIARNYAIDQRRQRRFNDSDGDEVDDLIDPSPGPDDVFAARVVLRRIVLCLDTLDPVHALAVKQAYLDGKSYDELATHHRVPINTMRTWLRRSLQKLRDCMAD